MNSSSRANGMTLNEYQKLALRTAGQHVSSIDKLNNAALGLAGEAGEFCDLLKKGMYQGTGFDLEYFKKEVGDCLFYLALAADALQTDLESIAQMNIEKLEVRYPDGFDPIRANNRAEGDLSDRHLGE